jgi:hypothetical protein
MRGNEIADDGANSAANALRLGLLNCTNFTNHTMNIIDIMPLYMNGSAANCDFVKLLKNCVNLLEQQKDKEVDSEYSLCYS